MHEGQAINRILVMKISKRFFHLASGLVIPLSPSGLEFYTY